MRTGGQNLTGWLQSYRATLGVRAYQHSEFEGEEIGTTFHNDTMEGEVLLSHKRTGRLVGSFGGWFLNRAFEAIGEEALSPPVDQSAARHSLRRSGIRARALRWRTFRSPKYEPSMPSALQ